MTASFAQLARGYWLEGLALDERSGCIWYSDVTHGGVHRISADGTVRSFDLDRRWTGGLLVNDDGKVLATGAGGIRWHDPAGHSGRLLRELDGQSVNGINEMAPDGSGGIYFGTADLDSVVRGKRPQPTAIYHLARDGVARRMVDGIGFTNGIAVDVERRMLYCNDTFTGTWAFTIEPDGGLADKRLLLEKADADGMALDAQGNLWITGCTSGAISRVAPDGTQLEPFATPAGGITQLRFGGAELRDLYLTVVPVDGARQLRSGETSPVAESSLLRTHVDSPGRRLARPAFELEQSQPR